MSTNPPMVQHDLAVVERLTASRRSTLLVDRTRPVPAELVERLVALMASAPNHKRTRPWRVAACTGEARAALGQAWAGELAATGMPEARLEKVRGKYLRAPVVLVVGCALADDASRHAEDRLAVAAGVQNVLLGATAAGLASMWASPPVVTSAAVGALLRFDPGTEVVAVVYLGWPASDPPPVERHPVPLRWVTGSPS